MLRVTSKTTGGLSRRHTAMYLSFLFEYQDYKREPHNIVAHIDYQYVTDFKHSFKC